MSEIATTPTSISLRAYLERIRIDSMTWGEAAELERLAAAEVAAEQESAAAVCLAQGHDFQDVSVDYFSADRETRCVRCGALEVE
jgi:hypothetical protein